MIVWVASYPRSGNSLVMSLLWSMCGCRTSSVLEEWDTQCRATWGYERISYEKFAYWMLDKNPHFIKTHSTCTDSLPAIYVVRDGRDVMCSLAHFTIATERTDLPFEDILRQSILDQRFSWSRQVLWWTKKRASFAPTAVVKFEDLVRTPALSLCDALEQLKVSVDIRGIPLEFEQLQRIEPRQFRSGQVGMWKAEMNESFQGLFWNLHGNAMKELQYS